MGRQEQNINTCDAFSNSLQVQVHQKRAKDQIQGCTEAGDQTQTSLLPREDDIVSHAFTLCFSVAFHLLFVPSFAFYLLVIPSFSVFFSLSPLHFCILPLFLIFLFTVSHC